MNNTESRTIAEIVADDYKTADIFKKYGIDFCCGGKKSLQKTCEQKQININDVISDLEKIKNSDEEISNYKEWDLDKLSQHIISKHHKYVSVNIPIITEYSEKVAKVHGHYYTEVVEINNLFKEIANELLSHMQKEEMILFPYINSLADAKRNNTTIPSPPFGTILNPINMMEMEHENAGDIIKKIQELSNNFTPPKEACNTYRVLYAKLDEFEKDLFLHIHLENNILFPKAVVLEKQLLE